MSTPIAGEKRDLVLAPGEYAYLQDETRGQIKTHVGPTVINQTAQDRPVRFDPTTMSFQRCGLEQAVVKAPIASEGTYLVLENPAAKDSQQPEEGGSRPSPSLQVGRKVNIPGPCLFSLWPGQRATVIPGHHLRSNQFLIVRVYNETEAKANWNKGVVATSTPGVDAPSVSSIPEDLAIGKLLLIKGTEVSFYIPPTGIEVVPDSNGSYVREAETLEVLEYAILTDEDGTSRYEIGPQVVFPKPTETFYSEGSRRKFRAIELAGDIQGIHVKVITAYTENGRNYKVGDELFIKGNEASIYYPRKEHSIIRYGEKEKHFATAIPVGEARYVLNRTTGEIKTEAGPQMLLPDPRTSVIVRRILNDKQCDLWYPTNTEAKQYNQALRAMQGAASATGRAGFISEGEVATNVSKVRTAQRKGLVGGPASAKHNLESMQFSSAFPGQMRDAEEEEDFAAAAESFQRGTHYTQPRTVTLDTKYDGVPAITVWVGYAVLVVSKSGSRRVVQGPANILLAYDESLEVLELSTGKPKSTDNLQKNVYLRTANNKVSDIVNVITKDRVVVSLKLSYRINFEGDNPERWFSVENYVKFACDHARSVLKGAAQKRPISDFDSNGVDIVRDVLLGNARTTEDVRTGLFFSENSMRITDVEVLGIEVVDAGIAKMLDQAQHQVVASNIKLSQAEKELEVTRRQQEIEQETETCKANTMMVKQQLQTKTLAEELILSLAKVAAELKKTQEQIKVEEAKQDSENVRNTAELARIKAREMQSLDIEQQKLEQRLTQLKAEVDGVVARFTAASPGFTEAIVALGNHNTLREVAQAMSAQNLIGGKNVVDVISNLFKDTPLAGVLTGMMNSVGERMSGGNGSTPVAVATKR